MLGINLISNQPLNPVTEVCSYNNTSLVPRLLPSFLLHPVQYVTACMGMRLVIKWSIQS